MKQLRIAAVLVLLALVPASSAYNLRGLVTDVDGLPLAGVTVSLAALERGTTTTATGSFELLQLPPGRFIVELSLLGYRRETRTINPGAGDSLLSVILLESPLELAPVTVTASPQPASVRHTVQPVTVLEGRHLDRQRGQTVMDAVKSEPGIALLTTGAIAKPVIRGLSSQRVLVVADGIRQEGHQWGDEHGPEIDALDIERIEIVRGPSSVLFGSEALGGVINIVRPEVPEDGHAPRLGGTLRMETLSVNRQGAGSAGLYGADGGIGYRAAVSVRNAGDVYTPHNGRLFNSGLREQNMSGMIGLRRPWGTAAVDYSRVGQKIEIHEDPAEAERATPYQKIAHDRWHVHTNFPTDLGRLELHGGWQVNNRQEFEHSDAADPTIHLKLATLTVDAKAHHRPIGRIVGTVGLSMMNQSNETGGEEFLIPGYALANVAGYLFEQWIAGPVTVSGGARIDRRSLDPHVFGEDVRNFHALTGSLGAAWTLQPDLTWTVSGGRGWRAPTAFELFAFGVHEGTQRFEIGDPGLRPEAALNVETGLRYHSRRVRGDVAVYQNAIDDYIYPDPTDESLDGHDVYRYAHADAVLKGAEVDFELEAAPFLVVTGGADAVRGDNLDTGNPLPLIPADRARLGLRVLPRGGSLVRRPYVGVESTWTRSQTQVAPYEPATAAYALLDVSAGAEWLVGHQPVIMDINLQNALNAAYRSHLSRYKAYALDPGRSVSLKLALPFVILH